MIEVIADWSTDNHTQAVNTPPDPLKVDELILYIHHI